MNFLTTDPPRRLRSLVNPNNAIARKTTEVSDITHRVQQQKKQEPRQRLATSRGSLRYTGVGDLPWPVSASRGLLSVYWCVIELT